MSDKTPWTAPPWHIINAGGAIVGDPDRVEETFIAAVYGRDGNGNCGAAGVLENARLIAASPKLVDDACEARTLFANAPWDQIPELANTEWAKAASAWCEKHDALLTRIRGEGE